MTCLAGKPNKMRPLERILEVIPEVSIESISYYVMTDIWAKQSAHSSRAGTCAAANNGICPRFVASTALKLFQAEFQHRINTKCQQNARCIWVRGLYNFHGVITTISSNGILTLQSRSLEPCSDQHRPVATNEHRPCARSSQQRRPALHPRHSPRSPNG